MPSFEPLAGQLFAEEVARARTMDPGEKLLEGPRLFERACRLMMDGIRHQHPGLDDEGVRTLLTARLAAIDALETPLNTIDRR